MPSASVTAEVSQLEGRLASEVAESALLADIEATLRRLRHAYRTDRAAFNPALVAKLQHFAHLAQGLRLFSDLLDHHGDIDDWPSYQSACGEFGTLLTLFDGLPVQARVQREWEALQTLEPMVRVINGVAPPPPPARPDLPEPDLFGPDPVAEPRERTV